LIVSSAPSSRHSASFFLGTRRGDHLCAHHLAEFHGRGSNAAGGAEYQQRLALFELRALFERVVGGEIRHRDARGLREIQSLGHRHDGVLIDGNLFAEAAMAGHGDHLVADLVAIDALADGDHLAGALAAGYKGHLRLELVLALDDQHVGEVQARGPDADDDLALLGLRRRPVVHQFKLVRQSVFLAQQCAHGVLLGLLIRVTSPQRPTGPRTAPQRPCRRPRTS
jgi:hypothetical protein